jgi:hypothetical protein
MDKLTETRAKEMIDFCIKYYQEEHEKERKEIEVLHEKLLYRVTNYSNTIYNLKDTYKMNYFNYYLEMMDFFPKDHSSYFCQECSALKTVGHKQLAAIQRHYCKDL